MDDETGAERRVARFRDLETCRALYALNRSVVMQSAPMGGSSGRRLGHEAGLINVNRVVQNDLDVPREYPSPSEGRSDRSGVGCVVPSLLADI